MGFFSTFVTRCISLMAAVVCCCTMVACTPQPLSPIRIASNQWPGYQPIYLARDLGYFEDNSVTLLELPNASVMLNAFRNHTIDIATLTLDEVILLQHDGLDLRILLVMDDSYGADVLMAKPEIKSLEELKGKRIGLETGALGAFMLSRSLEVANLRPSDVIPVGVTLDKQVQAYKEGSLDALVTFDPVRTELLNAGARILLDSKKMPNEIFDVLVVHNDIYQQRPEEMKKIIDIWFQTLAYIKQNPEESVDRMSPRTHLTRAEFMSAMQGIRQSGISENRRLLLGDQPALNTPAKKLVKVMLENKLIGTAVDPSRLIDKNHKRVFP